MKRAMKILGNRKGAVVALMAVSIAVFCGVAALVVDLGVLYVNKAQLVNAADSAALAGAQLLPGNPNQATATATSYANLNKPSSRADAPSDVIYPVLSLGNTTLTVTINRNVELFFAKIWGLSSSMVSASATASVQTLSSPATGIVPFGIAKQTFIFGQTYRLKLGGGSGYDGNFQALALGGTGASVYSHNIKYGYNGSFKIGDWIFTETGNMSGPTAQGVSYRLSLDPGATFETVQSNSSRIIIVPVLDSLTVSGRTDVLITGFAAFFLEGSGSGGNNSFVYGKFRQMIVPGATDPSAVSYGLYGVRLTN